jgi:hypothetical protein
MLKANVIPMPHVHEMVPLHVEDERDACVACS